MSFKPTAIVTCTVRSCKHQEGSDRCNLESVDICPTPLQDSGMPEDESMCGSYKSRG